MRPSSRGTAPIQPPRPAPSARLLDAAYVALASAILVWLTYYYRTHAWFTPDTEDYLLFAAHRPVGYGAFIQLLRWAGLGEDLRFLPQLQAVLLVGALTAFARAVGRSVGFPPAGLAVLALPWLIPTFSEAPNAVMTEAPFLAVTLGTAALCLAAGPRRPAVLLGIGACLGVSILLRTTGFAVAIAVLLFLAFGARVGWRGLALAAAPLIAAWLVGAAAQAQINGRFALGSFGGVSLVGKGALLVESGADLPEALRGLPEAAAEARGLIEAAPHWGLRARLRLQAYEDLRWNWIWPRAEAGWQGWEAQNPSTWAALSGRLAAAQIAANPLGYARLVAEDYLALFLWPEMARHSTLAEDRRFLAERPRALIAARCDVAGASGGVTDCWPVLPRTPAVPLWLVVLPLSVLALPLSLGVIAVGAAAVLGLATRPNQAMLLSALLLQAQASATALAEGGLLRYVAPLVPFAVALAVGACAGAARRFTGPRAVPGYAASAGGLNIGGR